MKQKRIPFNKPYFTGKETEYIKDAVAGRHLSGNGPFTKKCQAFVEDRYQIRKCLLTTSCTDALEMAAILLNIKEGDEVIMPSYTFVSTANAFILRGAKIIFCDSRSDHPGMDEDSIEALITPKTKVIVPVHYAGVACDMEKILQIAKKHDLFVVEDAAQAIDSYFTFSDGKRKALGSIGDLGTYSFHETKNIISGEGGCLTINNPDFAERAEIIWEKGTNRSAFFRGEINKYGWVDIGSSFLPSEINAAFLFAQLEEIEQIQNRRKEIWLEYETGIENPSLKKPHIPECTTNNAHLFYLLCKNESDRNDLISRCNQEGINVVFHYLPLHRSKYFEGKHSGKKLVNADYYGNCLLRLPFYYELNISQQKQIIQTINSFSNV